jgi:hypothetical protein
MGSGSGKTRCIMNASEIAAALGGKRVGNHFVARCPAHDDHDPSLNIEDKNGKPLVICRAGCPQGRVIAALRDLGAWPSREPREPRGRFVCAYSYTDEAGKLLFQVVRKRNPKIFPQRRPDGKGGWIWSIDGVRKVLYRLPQLVEARTKQNGHPPRIFVVEGEKDADRLAAWGLTATTNPGGAGKWRAEYNAFLADFDIVILGDNDDPGRAHVARLAASLAPVAALIRIPSSACPIRARIYPPGSTPEAHNPTSKRSLRPRNRTSRARRRQNRPMTPTRSLS